MLSPTIRWLCLRVSLEWWHSRLSAKTLALLRLSVNFFQLRLTDKATADSRSVQSLAIIKLFRAANTFRVTWSERVRQRMPWPRLRGKTPHRPLGLAMSTVASEKNRENVVYRPLVLQTVTSLRVVSLVFRGHDLLKIANINRQQEATLSLWKKISFPRERRKWSLGLGQHLKGALPNVRTEPH